MRRALYPTIVAVLLAGGSPTAHHSYAAYDMDLVIQVDGVLEALEWVSPHSLLKIRTGDALYTIEWRAPNAMARTGVGKDFLKVGERLIVTGNPRRDLVRSGIVNLKAIQRPSDGWRWPGW